MPLVYGTATINARLQTVISQIDAGAGDGVIKVGSAGMASTLITFTLSKPSGTAAAGVLTFVTPASATVLVAGTAAAADIEDSSGNVIASGLTVGNSSAFDILVVSTTFNLGDTIALVGATITGT